jgi:hypothetical protein
MLLPNQKEVKIFSIFWGTQQSNESFIAKWEQISVLLVRGGGGPPRKTVAEKGNLFFQDYSFTWVFWWLHSTYFGEWILMHHSSFGLEYMNE